ncbi:MAG: PorV/PorQ family protein [Candidatus Marinimicrobia bacterium]|nr:PorV/PorQ family protein [Candidatus Neomarinimicrobiota bacterium]
MKYLKILFVAISLILLFNFSYSQSQAGAIWLLINPGARADGMGEANVAIANDAYASYYNPAGLGFLRGKSIGLMHTQWLPNLASDIYYDYVGGYYHQKYWGTFGAHIIMMNLGKQIATDERGKYLGTFASYVFAVTLSYGSQINRYTSIGLSVKLIHQHLTDILAGREKGKGYSSNIGFDFGYLKKNVLTDNLNFGFSISNIGSKIAFIDVNQADPMPTNLKLGFAYTLGNKYNKINIAFDINKLLVASYPDRDIDGDGKVGGYDKSGRPRPGGDYNKDGRRETAHSDPWYIALFTSWIDDWLLVYDSEADGIGEEDEDGNTNDGSFKKELESIVYNFGIEYWYSDMFAIRTGFLYDYAGKIVMKGKYPVPTYGVGLKYAGMSFDFGYTWGDPGHPRQNTMLFSLNIKF